MLRGLTEYGNNVREEVRVTLSEIKKNLQGTISGGEEARIQINDLEHKEEISIQPEQQEEPRIQQNKDSIRSLWNAPNVTNLNHRDARRKRGRARN